MSSTQDMQNRAADAMRSAGDAAQQAIDAIPPDAWPVIDQMMRVLIVLFAVWLVLSLIAWWRRRAYNLTVASTAARNKQARPGFLKVDHEAREAAIRRGEAHADLLDQREADEMAAALKASAGPVGMLEKLARFATLLMSIFTLLTGFSGAIFNVTSMGRYIEEAGVAGRIEYLLTEHPIGCAVAVFVIGFNIWRYFAEKKWEGA